MKVIISDSTILLREARLCWSMARLWHELYSGLAIILPKIYRFCQDLPCWRRCNGFCLCRLRVIALCVRRNHSHVPLETHVDICIKTNIARWHDLPQNIAGASLVIAVSIFNRLDCFLHQGPFCCNFGKTVCSTLWIMLQSCTGMRSVSKCKSILVQTWLQSSRERGEK